MDSGLNVLAVFAHPDDAEFLVAGTLALLSDAGAAIHIATLTAGDCGSGVLPADKISKIRLREAESSAQVIGTSYTCLGEKDLRIFYEQQTLGKVTELVRRIDPSLVFTHFPHDYMADHETTSRLCQTACFGAMAPNFRPEADTDSKATRAIPHLYYAQPFGGKNILGENIPMQIFVNIAEAFGRKEKMLACHESQAAYLSAQQKIPDSLEMMRRMASGAGVESGFERAEGFRQHLGQGFPQENLLLDLLGKRVHVTAT